jgi:hypothetical protein
VFAILAHQCAAYGVPVRAPSGLAAVR